MLFPAMVSLGVLTAHLLTVHRARRLGLDVALANRIVAWVLVLGFLGAVVGKWIYRPDPLWRPIAGLSSFGGMLGGLSGAALCLGRSAVKRGDALRYCNALAYAFPFGWVFGRGGCALVHDHPGLPAVGWLTHLFADGRRYDLGLIELVFFAAPVALLFAWMARRDHNFAALLLMLYAPFRLALDRLHENPPRIGLLTVDQAGALVLLTLGLWFWYQDRNVPSAP